jgi:BCD family chlorophyll transporter-like MFS transporter
MSESLPWGIALAIVAFMMIGLGVSASGTALLVLLAKRVDEKRKAAAASCVWLMMIFGFAMTAGISGRLLDPFSFERLVLVSLSVSCIAVVLSFTALYGLEPKVSKEITPNNNQAKLRFKEALADVWQESRVRRFTIFVFISMLAYSSQDLILEPFAGTAFGLTPGETTSLSGLQHAGVLCGMLLCGFVTNKSKSPSLSSLRMWTVGGCIASALAMLSLVMSGIVGPSWPFLGTVFILGVSNGAFSIAAIGSMMQFAGLGKEKREGVRMGVWGAAQAIAFGLGGILGTGASDLARYLLGDPVAAYASVFFIEAILFMAAAILSFYIRPVERVVQIEKQNTSISGRLISHGGSS